MCNIENTDKCDNELSRQKNNGELGEQAINQNKKKKHKQDTKESGYY